MLPTRVPHGPDKCLPQYNKLAVPRDCRRYSHDPRVVADEEESVGLPLALPIRIPHGPDKCLCRQASNNVAIDEEARRPPIVTVQQHFEEKIIVPDPSCPMVDMPLVNGCLWGTRSTIPEIGEEVGQGFNLEVGQGFNLEVVTLPYPLVRPKIVRGAMARTPNKEDWDGGLARVAMVKEDWTSSGARVARYAQPPGKPDPKDPAWQLPRHSLVRSSSYDPLEPCPQGMWPNESYDKDTEVYEHLGPQLTSAQWLPKNLQVDLQTDLAGAADPSAGARSAAKRVSPWLQTPQGAGASPNLKRERGGSSPKPQQYKPRPFF